MWKNKEENMNRLFVAIASVVVILCVGPSQSKSVSKCSESEHSEIQTTHLSCTKQVEERYALLASKFEARLPSPAASALANATNERDPDILHICNMMHDVVEKCGQLYQKCLDENQYRSVSQVISFSFISSSSLSQSQVIYNPRFTQGKE